jgi:hypothetical protein
MQDSQLQSKKIAALYYIDEERDDEELAEFFDDFNFTVYIAIAHRVGAAILQDKGWEAVDRAYDVLVELGRVDQDEDDSHIEDSED